MRIGLVRHFRVAKSYPDKLLVSPAEVTRWFQEYDQADVEPVATDLGGINWLRCYSSDLPRAVKTAASLFPGPVVQLPELREVPVYPLTRRQIPLPFLLWAGLVRLSWFLRHPSQLETVPQVKERIRRAVDRIMADGEGDVLIVSHAALMLYLRRELLHRGFCGPRFGQAVNGKLYLYERKESPPTRQRR